MIVGVKLSDEDVGVHLGPARRFGGEDFDSLAWQVGKNGNDVELVALSATTVCLYHWTLGNTLQLTAAKGESTAALLQRALGGGRVLGWLP